MMTMGERFSRTSAAYPTLMPWDMPFDWADPVSRMAAIQLVQRQNAFAAQGQRAFLEYCEVVGDDVGGMAVPGAIGFEPDTIDDFRVLFALLPMEMCLVWGLNGQCHGWAMWSVARGVDREARLFEMQVSFLAPDAQGDEGMRDMVIANLPRWAAAFYMMARKFGGVDELARRVAPLCWELSTAMLRRGGDVGQCLEALATMANWASNADEPQAAEWVGFLLDGWKGAMPDANRAQIGILMMSPAHRFTGREPQDWADEMLADWSDVLLEHMELQVLATSLRTTDDWRDRRGRILAAAADLARSYREQSDDETVALQALESRVSILHPLIWFLTRHGTVDDVLDVLGAWYVPDGGRTCDGDVLFVAAGHENGVAYLWPGGGLALPRGEGPTSFDALLAASSVAQREYHRATAVGDDLPDIDFDRMGQPDEAAGPALEEATRTHLEPTALAAALPAGVRIRSVLTMPSLPAPIPALLATEAGVVAAEEVSLRRAMPDRAIRRVAVWQGGTMHDEFEIEALNRVAALAGWRVDVHGDGDPAAFERLYADGAADLLWVIGHGEHSPHRIEGSGLVIGDHLVTAERLRDLARGADGRRLLVLNVCSGATAQVRGGIARIGIAQELTGPVQQVAAHLWPVGMYAGLAFGAKFALELASGDAATAYARTIAGMRAPVGLRADLLERLGPGLQVHDRLANQDGQVGNVMSWGAPVLLT